MTPRRLLASAAASLKYRVSGGLPKRRRTAQRTVNDALGSRGMQSAQLARWAGTLVRSALRSSSPPRARVNVATPWVSWPHVERLTWRILLRHSDKQADERTLPLLLASLIVRVANPCCDLSPLFCVFRDTRKHPPSPAWHHNQRRLRARARVPICRHSSVCFETRENTRQALLRSCRTVPAALSSGFIVSSSLCLKDGQYGLVSTPLTAALEPEHPSVTPCISSSSWTSSLPLPLLLNGAI